jgi:hypothetical protein
LASWRKSGRNKLSYLTRPSPITNTLPVSALYHHFHPLWEQHLLVEELQITFTMFRTALRTSARAAGAAAATGRISAVRTSARDGDDNISSNASPMHLNFAEGIRDHAASHV